MSLQAVREPLEFVFQHYTAEVDNESLLKLTICSLALLPSQVEGDLGFVNHRTKDRCDFSSPWVPTTLRDSSLYIQTLVMRFAW